MRIGHCVIYSIVRHILLCHSVFCPCGQAVSSCQLCCHLHPQWGDIPHNHQTLCHGDGERGCQVTTDHYIRYQHVSTCYRSGGIVAPFIVLLGDYYPNLQFTIFGSLTFISGLLNLRLPETLGKKLPETVCELLEAMESKKSQENRSGRKSKK